MGRVDILELDRLVFHPWVAQGPRNVRAFVRGAGSFLIDDAGRRYLDFSSQLVFTNVGHQHPEVVSAIKSQAGRLCTLAPGWASDVRGQAAKLIVDVAPAGLNHVLFTNGGTEAIEHASRMARIHTGRPNLAAEAKAALGGYFREFTFARRETVGWSACDCDAGFQPGVVLDPFMGTGTTLKTALEERAASRSIIQRRTWSHGQPPTGAHMKPSWTARRSSRVPRGDAQLDLRLTSANARPRP